MIYGSEIKDEKITANQCFYKAIGDKWYKIILSVFIIFLISVIRIFTHHDTDRVPGFFLNISLITFLSSIKVCISLKNYNIKTKVKAFFILITVVYTVRLILFYMLMSDSSLGIENLKGSLPATFLY